MGIISILGPIGPDADFIGGASFASFSNSFNSDPDPEVTVEIFSPGGSVIEGLAIYDLIRSSEKQVTTKVIGMAGSIASIIALAGDRVTMSENAQFFIHNPKIEISGDVEDLQQAAILVSKIEARLIDIYSSRSKLGKRILDKLMKDETTFNAEQALEAGFVDEIVEPIKATALLINKFKSNMDKSIKERLEDMVNYFTPEVKPEAQAAVAVAEEAKAEEEIKEVSNETLSVAEEATLLNQRLDSLQQALAAKDQQISDLTKALEVSNQDTAELKTLISGTIKPKAVSAMSVGHLEKARPDLTAFAYGGPWSERQKEIKERHNKTYGYGAQN